MRGEGVVQNFELCQFLLILRGHEQGPGFGGGGGGGGGVGGGAVPQPYQPCTQPLPRRLLLRRPSCEGQGGGTKFPAVSVSPNTLRTRARAWLWRRRRSRQGCRGSAGVLRKCGGGARRVRGGSTESRKQKKKPLASVQEEGQYGGGPGIH